ncbi:MAG: hypothetical protein HKO65_16640 [Gemmatimonadetes bacterium]|nr:hypothetical protein [Gemmatimonadota bacterium]NNM06724.1 hypothetical protein [Gemmatimonadota bacterium]
MSTMRGAIITGGQGPKGWIVNCTGDQRSVYGWHRDGAYADFMLAEEYTLLKLPEELSCVDGAII